MYTINELAALTGRTVNELHNVRKTVLKDCVVNPGRNPLLYDAKAVALIDEYYNPPSDWLTRSELQSQIGVCYSVLCERIRQLPKAVKKRYIRKFQQGRKYNPEIKRYLIVERTNPQPLELVAPVPDKDLLTCSEFTACFGVPKRMLHSQIIRGYMPEKYLVRGSCGFGRVKLIRREAVDYVLQNGKTWMRPKPFKDGRIDWERLIVIDEYELTPEQHLRRLELRNMVKGDVPDEEFEKLRQMINDNAGIHNFDAMS